MQPRWASVCVAAWCITSAWTTPTDAADCRDRILQPFASSSVWNMPIGSEAQYQHASLFVQSQPKEFHNDQDLFIVTKESDPLTPWYNQGGWGSPDNCKITGSVCMRPHFPYNWTTASEGGRSAAGQVHEQQRRCDPAS